MKPTVLFFLTDFNSVDHMVPVAYKLAATGRGNPVLLFTNPFYNTQTDYRLNFLKSELGIGADFAFLAQQPNTLVRRTMAALCHPSPGHGARSQLYPKVVKVLSRLFYRQAWAAGLLKKHSPQALIFERAQPAKGLVGALVSQAKRRGIPTLSFPHGLNAYTNELANEDEVKAGTLPKKPFRNHFDHVVYQASFQTERAIKEGLSTDRVAVLGSARFCEEWSSVNRSIQPVTGFQAAGDPAGRLKAVFMLTQWNINVHRRETLATIKRIGEMRSLYLVVKPHPRQGIHDLAELLAAGLPPNVEIAWDTPSPALTEWCDVLLNIGSSIALEALLQKKPLLQLNYLHSNRTVFQDEGACWNLGSDEELVKALEHMAGGGALPYGDAEVGRVMRQLVQGGSDDRDVLGRYVDFILAGRQTVARQAAPTA